MLSRSETALLALGFLLLVLGPAMPARAAETTSSEIVIVRAGDAVNDDLYAAAVRVIVEGEIHGDLVVFAAEEVVINGRVSGSVIAVAPRVRIDGEVGDSVRAVATSVDVSGQIGDDLVVVAFEAAFGAGSRIAADALVWSSQLETNGVIVGDLGGTQRSLRLGGSIEGEVDVSVAQLTVAERTSVTGDLGYRSDREAVGLEGAEVGGSVAHRTPLPPNIRVRALGLFGRFLMVLFVALSVLAVAYLWPESTRAAAARLSNSPVRNWLVGAVVLFSPLALLVMGWLIFVLAPPAASLPLILALIPVLLALIGVALVAAVAAAVTSSVWVGRRVSSRLDFFAAALVGALLAGLLWLVPVVGWLVPFLLLPWGLGGWISSSSSTPVAVIPS